MGAVVIQKKIYSAYAKVAQKLGYDYDIYRPITWLDPMQPANWIDTKKFTSAPTSSFKQAQQFSVPILDAYIDGNIIRVGDLLRNDDQNRTFFVISKQPHLPINVIEGPSLISITRAGYASNVNGSFEKTPLTVATNVPANISAPSARPYDNGTPVKVTGAVPKWIVYLWMPDNMINVGDVITDNFGNRAVVHAVSTSPLGYQLSCVEPGK
jgi:hypothetical protein